MQAIKDVYLFVAVMILVTLDIIIIGLYLLSTGLTGHLGAILTSSRENPIDIVGVSYINPSLGAGIQDHSSH